MKRINYIKSILSLFALAIIVFGAAAAANAQVNPAQAQYRKALDFDGDGKADMTVLRRFNMPGLTWYSRDSSTGTMRTNQYGLATSGGASGNAFDTPQAGDYDGDGKADLTVVRRGQGAHSSWFVLRSGNNVMSAERFGLPNDITVAADYDGDGKTDMAVMRYDQNQGVFTVYVQQSSNNQLSVRPYAAQPGLDNCAPKVGVDIDGDGKQDLAQICNSGRNMVWVAQRTSDNVTERYYWGSLDEYNNSDLPAPADYDGDGKTDIAVIREVYPGSGDFKYYQWYIRRSSNGTMQTMQFGLTDETYTYDEPVPADYDGDGKADIAVFRQNNDSESRAAYFYIARSGSGGSVLGVQWGTQNDEPLKIKMGLMPSL